MRLLGLASLLLLLSDFSAVMLWRKRAPGMSQKASDRALSILASVAAVAVSGWLVFGLWALAKLWKVTVVIGGGKL